MAATWQRGVEQLAPGDHALLVYDSEERRVAALNVIAEAARALHVRGRQLIVAAAPEPVPGVLAVLSFDRLDGLMLR